MTDFEKKYYPSRVVMLWADAIYHMARHPGGRRNYRQPEKAIEKRCREINIEYLIDLLPKLNRETAARAEWTIANLRQCISND